MFSFENIVDLPLIWGGLISVAIFMYVFLDGFDLGIGILMPFVRDEKDRTRMFNSIAPFWDANETWLVLGGGGLLAAFPVAYAIVMPAFYLPVIAMLLGLIFRGVAFEFRFKAHSSHKLFWEYAFHFGSLTASVMQGIILGAYVQGIAVDDKVFAGQPFDWLTPFSLLTGVGLTAGYVLLGASWLVWKTEGDLQNWARRRASYIGLFVMLMMGLVSISVLFLKNGITDRWFGEAFFYLLPIPILTIAAFIIYYKNLNSPKEWIPFVCAMAVFVFGFAGLGASLWPYVVPFQVTLWDAAAAPSSLSFLLVGALIMLPVVLGYTAYCHYIFRGKTTHEAMY